MNDKVYMVGASDRYNYGDLLFPIITKNELLKFDSCLNVVNIGIVKSDLSSIGAMQTNSYKNIYNGYNNGVILFIGGEILAADWSRLLSFIYPWFFHLYNKFKNKKKLESFVRLLMGYRDNPIPFIPTSQSMVKRYKIIYHGVGGSGIKRKNIDASILKTIKNVEYFSVRDRNTFDVIKRNYNVYGVKLVPDPALIMSDHFSFEMKNKKKYITFQVGSYKHGNNLDLINDQLNILSTKTGMEVHFVPIGNCPGHDDAKSLLWLNQNSKYQSTYIKPDSLDTIMKTIAESSLFIGTSLHGLITAMSFNTPFIALNPNVTKVKNYIETWMESPFNQMCKFEDIAQKSLFILNNNHCLGDYIDREKNIVRDSFKHLANLIVNK